MDASLKILNAAESLFAVQGYEGTSTRDIARVSGANIAMISYYFGSKEALFQQLVSRRLGTCVQESTQEHGWTAWQQMSDLIDRHIDFVVEKPALFQIVARELLLPNSIVKDKITDFWAQYYVLVQNFVITTRETTNVNLLISTLFNAPIQLLSLEEKNEETINMVRKDLKRLFFSLLSPELQDLETNTARNREMILLRSDWEI
jgi:AcrR family transcriptional regulator